MLNKGDIRLSDIKIGHYKKTLTDIHQWQMIAKSRKPPFIHFLSWLFGN